jgi:hypothetical protein
MEYVFSLLIRLYEHDKIDQFWQISRFQCYKKTFFFQLIILMLNHLTPLYLIR